jgi:hypothetical protein
MKPIQRLVLAAAAALPLAFAAFTLPAQAQRGEFLRDVYGFQGSALDVEVDTEAPGRIRLIRGARSRIEVSGRAPNGFAAAALGGRGVRRLMLTALGAERVDFIVVVPEDVRVRVNWPGATRSELFGSLAESATFAWETPVARPAFETIRPGESGSRDDGGDALDMMRPRPAEAPRSIGGATPRILDISGARSLVRLTLRIEHGPFGISANRGLDAQRTGDRIRLVAPADGDVSILVPRGEDFTLALDGAPAVAIEGDRVHVLCESILSQVMPDGRRWLTLTPEAGWGCSRPHDSEPRSTPAGRRT